MDDNGVTLAPTPIVRITAEQLEYMISRITQRLSKSGDPARFQYVHHDFAPGAGSNPDLLGIAKNRAILIWSNNAVTSITVTTNAVPASGQGWQVSQALPILVLPFDTFGKIVTDAWGCFTSGAGTLLSAIEILAPNNLID